MEFLTISQPKEILQYVLIANLDQFLQTINYR